MKRLFLLWFAVSVGCASGTTARKERAPNAPIDGIPRDMYDFCVTQCSGKDGDIVMVSPTCFQECVDDLMRKSGSRQHQRRGRAEVKKASLQVR